MEGTIYFSRNRTFSDFLHFKFPVTTDLNICNIVVRVSEWLLFNAKCAIFQLYHGENKLNSMRDSDEVRFVLDQHA